ncbi:thiamine pyrophosphate-binding protein [Amycolatopsis rubida]|uniref:Thiamine pyrophosphate-binding protein n=1 Tax=Amycolatopsis rubida TaxID=112413 RepID=A0ABX0C5L6_9PSEU|nr:MULTISPECIES: thiamine pyrophosphate-binding protein [Amycolatopsis]MYW97438.1 thiamine pyrophosphate-binding protein [Amycolatopsis rubida]NEC62423.1 thiamine pyrophosphate-binding protein [Amycolatopsis rubida]OAP21584.1 Acetolactate synthase large subunit IlvB1 [Amycolatopsis sp. M39]
MSENTLTGGQMIVDGLIRQGVEVVFAVPGHGNTALLDAFVDREDEITVIQAMHEQGASHMADGYYRASGKIAAVCTSIGPGATNTVTGIATAFSDSQPQIVLTGSVHTYLENRGVLQEIDRPHGSNWGAVIEPIVKRWWRPVTLGQIPRVISQAFTTLREGRRGPVLLDVPQDLQAEAGNYEPVEGAPIDLPRPTGDIEAVRQAAELLRSAKRPVVLAGGGVIAAEASSELIAVAERLGAPVTHTFMGKGAVPADHDLYAWPCGDLGSIPGNGVTKRADVILAVGTRFSDRITSSYRKGVTFTFPETKLVHIDIDAFEIGRNYKADVGIVGDAKSTLATLAAELGAAEGDYRETAYFAELQFLKKEWEEYLRPAREADVRPVTNSRAMVQIREALPRDAVWVTDSSNPANGAFNEFPIFEPRTNIVAGGFSGIGFGLPAAIGAQIGAPGQQVVAYIGDGSLLQTGTELAVAAQLGVPVLVIVMNNGGWEAIKDLQINLFGADRDIITQWKTPDGKPYFADVVGFAESLGVPGERVEDPDGVRAAVERGLAAAGPYVVEVLSANALPWSKLHETGWWDITVPAYLGAKRDAYVAGRGF